MRIPGHGLSHTALLTLDVTALTPKTSVLKECLSICPINAPAVTNQSLEGSRLPITNPWLSFSITSYHPASFALWPGCACLIVDNLGVPL